MRTAVAFGCFAGATFCAALVLWQDQPAWILLPGVLLLFAGIAIDSREKTWE
jgi:hypothetical protein